MNIGSVVRKAASAVGKSKTQPHKTTNASAHSHSHSNSSGKEELLRGAAKVAKKKL